MYGKWNGLMNICNAICPSLPPSSLARAICDQSKRGWRWKWVEPSLGHKLPRSLWWGPFVNTSFHWRHVPSCMKKIRPTRAENQWCDRDLKQEKSMRAIRVLLPDSNHMSRDLHRRRGFIGWHRVLQKLGFSLKRARPKWERMIHCRHRHRQLSPNALGSGNFWHLSVPEGGRRLSITDTRVPWNHLRLFWILLEYADAGWREDNIIHERLPHGATTLPMHFTERHGRNRAEPAANR